jgi:hypothetical protein
MGRREEPMEQIRIRYTVAVLPPRPAAALTASTFESVIYDLLAEEHIAGAAEGNEWGVVPGGLTVEEIADEGPAGPHAPSIRRITVCHEMADRSPGDRRNFAARAEGFLTHALSIGHYEDPWYIAAIAGERAPEPSTLRRPRIATV